MPSPSPARCRFFSFSHLTMLASVAAMLLIAPASHAVERARNGFFLTGSATRVDAGKKDYTLVHEMREIPRTKTKRGVIDADVDKRFVLRLHRDLPCASVKSSLRDGFSRNAFANANKISQVVDTCSGTTLKAGAQVVIAYKASTKTTTFWVEGMGRTTVVGIDFMKAVWSVWMGNVAQPKLGESLVARL